MPLRSDNEPRTLTSYIEQYGSVEKAFWAAISNGMPQDERSEFEMRFFTESRCWVAVVDHVQEKYGTLLVAMQAYKLGSLTEEEMRAIELYVLPRGAFHIFL